MGLFFFFLYNLSPVLFLGKQILLQGFFYFSNVLALSVQDESSRIISIQALLVYDDLL